MRLVRPTIVLLGLLALLCGSASAKNYAPPGRAGTSQYAEDIPSDGGNVPTPAMGGGNKSSAEIAQIGAGKQGVRQLAKLGKSGAQAAQFAQATAPTSPEGHAKVNGGPTGKHHQAVLIASGGSVLSGLGDLLFGSDAGGIGVFLPLLLAISLITALATAGLRVRRSRFGARAHP